MAATEGAADAGRGAGPVQRAGADSRRAADAAFRRRRIHRSRGGFSRRDIEAPAAAPVSWEERTHAAVVAAGGSQSDASWQFPMPTARLGSAFGGHHFRVEYVARRPRHVPVGTARGPLHSPVARPDLILTENASPRGEEPWCTSSTRSCSMRFAARRRASSYPGQIAAGLRTLENDQSLRRSDTIPRPATFGWRRLAWPRDSAVPWPITLPSREAC